ncbi:MAG: nitrilase-related carbon-nitrogen hydrolase [Candidatus Hermodarchaeota archaeon]
MIVGYIQTNPIFGNKEKNFKEVEKLSANIKADLIVLPELFATGYTFKSKEEAYSLAESVSGSTSQFLLQLAQDKGIIFVGGFAEKKGEKLFNSALIVSENGVIGTYRKLHLYYREKLWFNPGDKPLRVYNVDGINIGMMICFDWIFPETARTLALLGAEIIAHPANLVLPYCQKAMVTRCLENKVYAITANRIGQEDRGIDKFRFTGGSQITSYDGGILSSAPFNQTFVGTAEIDINLARDKKLNEYNDLLADRRNKFYSN